MIISQKLWWFANVLLPSPTVFAIGLISCLTQQVRLSEVPPYRAYHPRKCDQNSSELNKPWDI